MGIWSSDDFWAHGLNFRENLAFAWMEEAKRVVEAEKRELPKRKEDLGRPFETLDSRFSGEIWAVGEEIGERRAVAIEA